MPPALPALTFTPNGFDTFIALMGLMVDVKVDVTYFHTYQDAYRAREVRELDTLAGFYIAYVDDNLLGVSSRKDCKVEHLPKKYRHSRHQAKVSTILIPWTDIRFLEIVA